MWRLGLSRQLQVLRRMTVSVYHGVLGEWMLPGYSCWNSSGLKCVGPTSQAEVVWDTT